MIGLTNKNISLFDFEAGEVLNIDKPSGMTSFEVVQKVRKWINIRKVGHAGTLDPAATGVLIICTGHATKRVSEFMDLEKEYEGVVELGVTTDSDDADGNILHQKEVPGLSVTDLQSLLASFEGEIEQIPPMYSAIKKNGIRLYKLARKGEIIEREARPVSIIKIDLLNWHRPFLTIRVICRKGTYIRSLARDIGEKLGTGGYLKSLRRTRIGPYYAKDSYSLEDFKNIITDERLQIH